ncbi:MAG: RNA polymerase sigma factor RpoH [Gammaproteobacteria bacterium]|nr:RNA polymerase sigma factor RpoH [Gammaproteobacteria bacterium]MBU1926643.1 RNA polymerase sigma factor RpoH [Gammaproteobacteria bacterium]MBU2546651.1 RNA polymerase sigma factor RpoH [Gammaproteobacteria bacterium]
MGTQIKTLDMSFPIGSLNAYIHRANQIPILSAEEEHDLAVRFYEQNDVEAARRLVLAHLRFVVKIARNYLGYGLALNDLIQEGNLGLMKAIKKFNPQRGVKLVTFAIHWIKAEIHEFILKNWKIVKVATTKAQRKLFFNLRSLKKHLNWLSNQEVDEISETLNVKQSTVREMEIRMLSNDTSLDAPTDDEDSAWISDRYLEDQAANPAELFEQSNWANSRQEKLQKALLTLDTRTRDIIKQRWVNEKKSTLHDLANQYNLSAERIRQIEQEAFLKLRSLIAESE